MKKKFHVLVKRAYNVTLELDEAITPDDEWRDTFYSCRTLEELAHHIAYNVVRFGKGCFIEGVGEEGELAFDKTGGYKILELDEDYSWDIRTN